MPHINRIRVNNVRYNFGTQFYDDFVMRFDGRNALYDLANGGGKSVLMLLLFQNLIPNCSLDDKQPIEKLFRTDQGSNVIHSLVEWQLDDRFVFDGYRYMLTGFCARKAREELKDTAAIEYFNYVIFYRNYNENDLVHLPLTEGKTRVTYTGLRSYLRELGRRDMRLEVKVFERKGEYQRFIRNYGLYESHWEILRGINRTEGHVRTWFETHYRTTRKVIEDLLIEDIIAPTYTANVSDSADMADTLLSIREQLVDLAKRKEQMRYYDRQMDILESFSQRVGSLAGIYAQKQATEEDMLRLYNSAREQYRHCMNDLNYREKEKALAIRRIKEIEKKIAAARIMASEERCTQASENIRLMEAKLKEAKDAREKLQSDIAIAESMEDLAEAKLFLQEAKALEIEAENDGADPMEIRKKLRELAGIRYAMIKAEKEENQARIDALETQISELSGQISHHEEAARKAIGDLAVADSQCENAGRAYEAHKARWQEISKDVTAEQALQVKAYLAEAMKSSETLALSLAETERLKEQLTDKIAENEKKQSEMSAQRMLLTADNDRLAAFFEAYEKAQEKLEKLKQIYRAADASHLAQILDEQLHKVIRDLEKKQELQQKLSKRLEACLNGDSIVSEACEQVMTYIRRCFDARCIHGAQYLSELDKDTQAVLMSKMPYLTAAVLTDGDIELIGKDQGLYQMDLDGAMVPVISLAEVMSTDAEHMSEGVVFVSDGHLYHRDDEAREALLRELEKKIEDGKKEICRVRDREEIIEADRKWLYGYMEVYEASLMKNEAVRQNNLDVLEQIAQAEKTVVDTLERSRESRRDCDTRLASGQKKQQTLAEDIERMKALAAEEDAVDQAAMSVQKEKRAAQEARRLKEFYDQKLNEAKMLQQSCIKQHQQAVALRDETDKEWQQLYAPYYMREAKDDTVIEIWDREKLHTEFMGLKAAAEKHLGDATAKKQLAEGKRQMAEALYKNIRKRGFDPEELARQAADTILADKAQLMQMTQTAEELAQQIAADEQSIREVMLAKERMEGSLSFERQNAQETYGVLGEVEITGGDYEGYIALEKEALAGQRLKADEEEKNIQNAMRYVRIAEETQKDIERMMEAEQIIVGRITESLPAGTDLKDAGIKIRKTYAQMKQTLISRREVYLEDRQKAVESLTLLEAVELASTLKGVAMPQTAVEAEQLMMNLADTAKIIRLEKERIAGAIHDMEQIKGNFEKQCLQRCASIKAELERFPMYSKINMDGKQVPMIRLRIPYVPEAQYEERMAAYIDDIVASTDHLATQEERADHIHRQLSMKRLFSVIVEDMNMIRLNLYKRERIREQSRYLRYEEAVGSTGQSQGIYIQFLIGVINYIAMVTSGGEDGSSMKKVIFIDNPFGAARDVYIWQPIFELLKANQVQLIVPTRGATPAITGMFDINYILGQRMIDRVQQTVVVDYNSRVEVDQMSFEPIEFEQQVFDFV